VRPAPAAAHHEVRLAEPFLMSRRSALEPVPVALGADHSHPRRREYGTWDTGGVRRSLARSGSPVSGARVRPACSSSLSGSDT
jgi:hypothetical protein